MNTRNQKDTSQQTNNRARWSSKFAFIIAATAGAVGLGNLWKFPYITYQNGGGLFVLIYLACIIVLGLPIIIAEIYLGKTSQVNPVDTFKNLDSNKYSSIIGIITVFTCFLLLSYYIIITGWSIEYLLSAVQGVFINLSPQQSEANFDSFISNPIRMMQWQIVILLSAWIAISLGVKKGIENSAKFLMPILIILLVVLAINSLLIDPELLGLKFLIQGDISKFSSSSFLEALGHSFFTLSVGVGVAIVYGSYLDKDNMQFSNVISTGLTIALIDTLIAISACLIIFPILFVYGFQPSNGGIGILFTTIPLELSKFPFGNLIVCSFYILVLFAAFSSVISLIEPIVSTFIEKFSWSRVKASSITILALFIAGIPSLYSINTLDKVDLFVSNILIPLNALGVSLFLGYRYNITLMHEEFTHLRLHPIIFILFRTTLRYIVPLCIFCVFIYSLWPNKA